ncbi:MAG: HAMP domain-containing sensor histidine kinase [Gemmatimonadaceae bacterium]
MLKIMVLLTSESVSLSATSEQLECARAALEAEKSRAAAIALVTRRMSHDMSNYVTAVRAYSELLLADLPATGSAHADVLEIHRAADAMIHYMQRIGRFTQVAVERPGTVQLDAAINSIIKENAAAPRIRAVLLSEATVRIEARWLVDAMNELIANAIEASPQHSLVDVRASTKIIAVPMIDGGVPIEAGVWACIEVADSGAGIDEDIKRRALDPFVTTKIAERCAGFGLTLARSAVWQAGGQLVLDGPSVKKPGTQVRLWLPVTGRA